MMNEEIARGMVCFFHQKKHSYLINYVLFEGLKERASVDNLLDKRSIQAIDDNVSLFYIVFKVSFLLKKAYFNKMV
jgi:hypothetical protein